MVTRSFPIFEYNERTFTFDLQHFIHGHLRTQKISHLKALYHLACADNVLTKAEAVYIRNVAERLGVDPKEPEKFEAHEPDLELPDTEYKTQVLFHRLVIITMIDKRNDRPRKTILYQPWYKDGASSKRCQ
jgi:hypothetical protein